MIQSLANNAWEDFSNTPQIQRTLKLSPQLAATFRHFYIMGLLEGGKLAGQVADAQMQELQQLKDKTIAEVFSEEKLE
jgi:hypothetical protein